MGGAIDVHGNVRSSLPSFAHPPPLDNPTIPCPPVQLIRAPPGPLRSQLIARNQITPVAEFNTYADTIAAARVFALTSPDPASTMPPPPPPPPGQTSNESPPPFLSPYPKNLSKQLKLTLFPLDITTPHLLTRTLYNKTISSLLEQKSPLAEWTNAFLSSTFRKMETLYQSTPSSQIGLQLHDPLTIWYVITKSFTNPGLEVSESEDIRIETSGQWTRGMCVVDRRSRKKLDEKEIKEKKGSDHGRWLSNRAGNRVGRCVGSEWVEGFGGEMVRRIFNLGE